MKWIVWTLVVVGISALPARAGDAKAEKKKDSPRWAKSIDEALAEAKDRHAPIFIYFGMDG